jgi:hypothetical protein
MAREYEIVCPPLAVSESIGWRGSLKYYNPRNNQLVTEVYKSTIGDTVTHKGKVIVLEGVIKLTGEQWSKLPKYVMTMLIEAEKYFPTYQHQLNEAQ